MMCAVAWCFLASLGVLAGEVPAVKMVKTMTPEGVIVVMKDGIEPLDYPLDRMIFDSTIAKLSVPPGAKKVILSGKELGEAELLYLDVEGKYHKFLVRVLDTDTKDRLAGVETHIKSMIDVKARVGSGGIINLFGTVYYPKDSLDLEGMEKQFGGKVKSLVTKDYEPFHRLLKKVIQERLKSSSLPAVVLSFVDSILQVEGLVPMVRMKEKIGAILGDYAKAHGLAFTNLVEVDFEERLKKILDELGWAGLQVKVGDKIVRVWGTVPSEEARKLVEGVLAKTLEKDQVLVPDIQIVKPEILVNIRFVSVGDSDGRQLGTDPAAVLKGGAIGLTSVKPSVATWSVGTGPLLELLAFWEDKGRAKTIVNLDLPVYANEKKSTLFRRVQEVRYQITSSEGVPSTQVVEAGLIIEVLATLERDNRIKVTLGFEASGFNGVGAAGIPNKVTSSFENRIFRLESGCSAMMADLHHDIETTFERKASVLNKVPILGPLFFKRRDKQKQKDRLFGIVSIVVKPRHEELEERFKKVGAMGQEEPRKR